MAVCTLKFSEDARHKAKKMSIQPDGGDVYELTAPGSVSCEATSKLLITVEPDESDLLWCISDFGISITKTDGTTSTLLLAPTASSYTLTIEEDFVEVKVVPDMMLGNGEATLYLSNYPGNETEITVTGHKRRLEIFLPPITNSESVIYTGWSKLYDGSVTVNPTDIAYPIDGSVFVRATNKSFLEVVLPTKWTTRLQTHTRNGLVGIYIGRKNNMRRANQYIGKNGKWVPCNVGVGVQGKFEVTDFKSNVLGVGTLGTMILGGGA